MNENCRWTISKGLAAGILRPHPEMKQPQLPSISNLKFSIIIITTLIVNLLIDIFSHNNISLKYIIKSNVI
jgi:hypothetical protein